MSAPSQAPSRSSAVIAPDLSSIVTEDDAPVDNIYSEKQQRLLTDALYTSWAGPPPEEDGLPRPFVATANVGVFNTPTDPPVVPDVLVSLDVRFGEDVREKEHRTYFVWIFGKVPDVVIEVVSNREGEELGKKKRKYQRMLVPSYVVWDPAGWLGETPLQTFELRGSLYIKKRDTLFEALGLGLVPWEGEFEGCASTWLRWVDAAGTLLPTGAERALHAEGRERQAQVRVDEQRRRADEERRRADEEHQRADEEHQRADEEHQRADEERRRADEERRRAEQARANELRERERAQEADARAVRLAEKLRALGIDPDAA